MKIIEDSVRNEEKVVRQLLDFLHLAKGLSEQTASFEKAGAGRKLPRFIAETAQGIQKYLVEDFGVEFPDINSIISNGEMSGGVSQRLHDACYKFGNVQKELQAENCVLRFDDLRERITDTLMDVVSDLAIYIIAQFSLHTANDDVELGVHKVCELKGITKGVLYGSLLEIQENTGKDIYAYEPISPVYQLLLEADPVFVEECSDAFFPLTKEMAEKIIYGEVTLETAREQLSDYIKESIE